MLKPDPSGFIESFENDWSEFKKSSPARHEILPGSIIDSSDVQVTLLAIYFLVYKIDVSLVNPFKEGNIK